MAGIALRVRPHLASSLPYSPLLMRSFSVLDDGGAKLRIAFGDADAENVILEQRVAHHGVGVGLDLHLIGDGFDALDHAVITALFHAQPGGIGIFRAFIGDRRLALGDAIVGAPFGHIDRKAGAAAAGDFLAAKIGGLLVMLGLGC